MGPSKKPYSKPWNVVFFIIVGIKKIIDLATNDAGNYEYDVGPYTDIVAVGGIAYLGTFNEGVQRIELASGNELSPWISSGLDELEEIPIEYAQNLVDVSLKYPEYDELVNNLVDAIGFNFEYFDDGPLDVKDLPN